MKLKNTEKQSNERPKPKTEIITLRITAIKVTHVKNVET